MNELGQRLAALSPEKRALLEQKLRDSAAVPRTRAITRRAETGPTPVSYAQLRLWFVDQFEPGSSLYNIPWGVRLCGLLNVAALERSLQELVGRHEVLRTTFTTVNGEPQPVVRGGEEFRLQARDLRSLPEGVRETAARQLAQEAADRPFDLSRDLPLR